MAAWVIRRESSSADSTRGTRSRTSMTFIRSARRLATRRDSSYFSWNIQRLRAPSTRVRSGSNTMRMAAEATSVLKKNSSCWSWGDPLDQGPVDHGHDEDQGGQHHHAAEQLVEVEQPVAHQRLREEKEVDGDEDVGEGGPPGAEDEVQQGEGDRRDAADHQVEEADLLDPRGGGPVAPVQVIDRRIEPREHVDHEGHAEPGARVQPASAVTKWLAQRAR